MNRIAKQETVERIRALFESSEVVILAHNKGGLTVSAANNVRKSIKKEADGKYFVAKNTLMKIAVKGTRCESLSELLTGPVSVVCASEPTTAAKALMKFCKDGGRLEVIGGVIGQEKVSVEHINMLATLPSLDELRAKLLSLVQEPARRIARVIALHSEK
ncbi:MAG: 50S ribosomal protein L10 [Candidatus Midichloria mitochondrii]|nr:50S ribosomal protein L10 [Candidatus Midichloria mitochondrii]MDJ1256248.1 50S ribosomal protein L10 [Candidatus Midichloria mitochondrii]MDJ1287945.1 50S ribosomal protein L10 [Candidatus Midichloria mitochondrii]MDJ1298795.1 50S ribosomal protein L10 [Candidatus Midichloria mitochondrii]MDJ1312596.1 50S ribosomal protein L10 [Candidatus Midichloria mitochondrii]MDJ1583111.1 50S ribosomal protein L10 [Candidatus Midichloria mitochondrii]